MIAASILGPGAASAPPEWGWMRIVGTRFLSGPNLYDDSNGVVIGTELGAVPPAGPPPAGLPLVGRPGRSDRIFAALAIPGLADEWAVTAARGREALPDFLLRLATALVTSASIFPSGGQVVDASASRLAVFLRCEHEVIGVTAWDCACKAVTACLDDDQVSPFEAALAAFRSAVQQYAADPVTAEVAREARRLDLPWYRLKAPGQFIQIGQGTNRRHLLGSTSDATGAISRLISQDKQLTNRLLRAAGVPVLAMAEVMNEAAAIAAAERIGYPVVVKPCHGGQGRGVSVRLTGAAEVAAAFKAATATPDSVIVEKFAAGDDYRVLVVGGKVTSVARRLSRDGGPVVDATEAIHPDNRAILERAASTLELAIAGINFLSEDIARSWREIGGAVLEMEAFPDLRSHRVASSGRSMIEPILRSLLPPGSDGRIPTCAVTGSVGKTTTVNMVARILGTMGLMAGRCNTEGVWVGDERQQAGDCAGGRYARDLLLDHRVQAGIFEIARGGLLKEGMGIAEVDVAAVLNIHENHVGADGIAGPADLARIKSIVARRARRMLVLNAEDPFCLAMRQGARAERLCLVGTAAGAPVLRDHIAAGGCAVTLRGSPDATMIVLADQGAVEAVIDPATIPATLSGMHRGKVWNAMFAVAIARAMGASLDQIRQGLQSFKADLADSQGRLTIIDRHPFRVVLDHAFGQQPFEELANAIRLMPATGRKWIYVTRAGFASDQLIRATGHTLAGAFDHYVCSNTTGRRMRPDPLAVPHLLRDGMLAGGVAADAITCIPDHEEALRYILGAAAPGDLVVINTHQLDKVTGLLEDLEAGRLKPAEGRPAVKAPTMATGGGSGDLTEPR
jgi:UDP-N-acetylmuramyl tripeptide synthase